MTDAEALVLWPLDVKSWLIGKDNDARKDWRQVENRMAEDELVGWHHWLNGHEFVHGEGQGSLVYSSPWVRGGCKEWDVTEQLNNNNKLKGPPDYGYIWKNDYLITKLQGRDDLWLLNWIWGEKKISQWWLLRFLSWAKESYHYQEKHCKSRFFFDVDHLKKLFSFGWAGFLLLHVDFLWLPRAGATA